MSEEPAAGTEGAEEPPDRGSEVPFGTGIAIGLVLGVVTGLVAGNMGVWVGVGVGVGVALDVVKRRGMLGLEPDEE